MGNHKREVILDCYFKGLSKDEAREKAGASWQYTNNLYDMLRFEEMKKKFSTNQDRLMQISAIERKLWELYDDYHVTRAPQKLAKINSLESAYVRFQALPPTL